MKTAETFLKEYYGIERDVENEKGLIHFDFLLKAMEEYASQLQGNKDLIIEKQAAMIHALKQSLWAEFDFLESELSALQNNDEAREQGAPFDEPGCFNPAKV